MGKGGVVGATTGCKTRLGMLHQNGVVGGGELNIDYGDIRELVFCLLLHGLLLPWWTLDRRKPAVASIVCWSRLAGRAGYGRSLRFLYDKICRIDLMPGIFFQCRKSACASAPIKGRRDHPWHQSSARSPHELTLVRSEQTAAPGSWSFQGL